MKLRIATRGSELALVQSRWVAAKLSEQGIASELVIIKTRGDVLLDKPLHELGGKGLFTKEVDRAVLDGRADLSVHSFKDMPVEDEPGLKLGAIPERESVRDVLVSNASGGTRVGCGSLRRKAQLIRLGLGYEFVDVRGNIHTRLEKMQRHNWAGLVVAEAALRRLGLDKSYKYEYLEILPAAGQGALGLRIRDNDPAVAAIVGALNSEATAIAATAEAEFLKRLGGGCHIPAGIYSELNGAEIYLKAGVFSPTGEAGVIRERRGDFSRAFEFSRELAEEILRLGGEQILDISGE